MGDRQFTPEPEAEKHGTPLVQAPSPGCSSMKIIRGYERKNAFSESIVTLGAYDGIHLGHQKILSEVASEGRKHRVPSVVVTFEPHPSAVLGDKPVPLITCRERKLEILENSGISHCVIINFSRSFSLKPAENFVKETIVDSLGAKTLIVGFNYVFGAGRKGNPKLLERLGEKYGFSLKKIHPVKFGGETVSSSLIRKLLLAGNIRKANLFLGRPFSIEGKVIAGDKRGKDLGFPTANIEPAPGVIMPAPGVYSGQCHAGGKTRASVLYTGKKPSFDRKKAKHSMEIHIIGFSGNLYGKRIRFIFKDRIRGELKFETPLLLKEQISRDVSAVSGLDSN